MKFQPKRFVVEVKRGTSRAAFASPDASAERYSSAEAVLFGRAPKVEPEPAPPKAANNGAAGGRVLRSLVEPPPPVVEDDPAPVRRGRKPGSKNKPKPPVASPVTVAGTETVAERPRRGRKPGSKNKPKVQVPTAFPATASGTSSSAAAAMRSYGFADDGTLWQDDAAPTASEPTPASPASAEEEGQVQAPGRLRSRLRERSTILRRYVLDIEPRPGQPGASRARRRARAAG